MIDDGQVLRASQPHGATEPGNRGGHADGFADFTMNKPSVTVVVKKRRGTPESQGDRRGAQAPQGGPGHEERRPRVYQVHPSTSTPGSPRPAWAPEPSERRASEADQNEPNDPHDRKASIASGSTPPGTLPARRRRARRDPSHAPGRVTRIVFETPPPSPLAAPAAGTGTPPFEFIERGEVGYEQVMAELEELGAELDLALSARRFRIG